MEKCTSKGLVSLIYIFLQVSIKTFRKIQIIWIDTLKKIKIVKHLKMFTMLSVKTTILKKWVTFWRRKWQTTPLFLPEKSMGRGVMGLQRVGHDWVTEQTVVFARTISEDLKNKAPILSEIRRDGHIVSGNPDWHMFSRRQLGHIMKNYKNVLQT